MTLEFDPDAPEFSINDNIILSVPKYYEKKSSIFSYKKHVEKVKEILENYDESKEYHTSFQYGDLVLCIIIVNQNIFKYSIIPRTNGGSHVSFSINYKENKKAIDKFWKYMVEIKDLDDPDEELDDPSSSLSSNLNSGGGGGGGAIKRKKS